MRAVRYTDAANADLREIALYIAEQSASRQIAEAFTGRLRAQCRKLAELPGTIGTPRPELRADMRSLPYQNYVIFFRYRDAIVEIVNVLESHRDVDGYFGN